MKRILVLFMLMLFARQAAYAVGLVDVYHDAVQSDQTFQQAEATFLENKEILPQARATLLPQITAIGQSTVNWAHNNGEDAYAPTGSQATRYNSSGYTLQATENLFNWGAFAGYKLAQATVNEAAATFAFSEQDLIYRVAQAYFAVLQAEEVLRYSAAQKAALESQLNVARQRYEVGLDPLTTVEQAQAAYDAASASYIAQANTLSNAKEDLRVITDKSYSTLNRLQYDFPLVSPNPASIDQWTQASVERNLNLKAARYGLLAAQDTIHAQEGNRLPNANLIANYGSTYNTYRAGATGSQVLALGTVGAQVNFDVFTGGAASSKVRQAEAAYQLATAQMELAYRQTIDTTRKAYLGVIAGVSQVGADRQAIKSSLSALRSTQAGYKVGTQTINDVLQQQQFLYQAQTTYAQDRFTYLLTTLQLKEAVGSLSQLDLAAIDQWLAASNESTLTEDPADFNNASLPPAHGNRTNKHKIDQVM